jgi:hypothetical protein
MNRDYKAEPGGQRPAVAEDIPTTGTDYKALCAELADALAEWQLGGGPPEDTADADLILRARAALAEPEPVALTDKEINVWHDQCADLTRLGEVDHYWAFDLRHDEVAGVVRAALAHWGQLTRGTH